MHICLPVFMSIIRQDSADSFILHVCSCVYVRVMSDMKAEGVEEACSQVEPQRGNEKNKQPLPVPLWPEISNTLTTPTITTSVRKDELPELWA